MVPDLAAAVAIAHAHGARVLVDAVARVPHLPTDVSALGVDALVTSPYKWYGPHAGVLVLHAELLAGVEPYRVKPADYVGPSRWETGTKAFEVLAGVEAAAELLLSQPWPEVVAYEGGLLARLETGLRAMEHVTVHTPAERAGPIAGDRAPTTIFTVAGHHPGEVAQVLADASHRGMERRQLRVRAGGRPRAAGRRRRRAGRHRALHERGGRRRAARRGGRPGLNAGGPPARMPAARRDHEP